MLREEEKQNMKAYKKTNTNRETDQDRQAEEGTDKSYNNTAWVDVHSAAQDRSLIHVTNSYLMLTAHMSRLPHDESLIILTTQHACQRTHLPATRPSYTHCCSRELICCSRITWSRLPHDENLLILTTCSPGSLAYLVLTCLPFVLLRRIPPPVDLQPSLYSH